MNLLKALAAVGSMTFEPVDLHAFPALARSTGRGPSGRAASHNRHARISVSSASSGDGVREKEDEPVMTWKAEVFLDADQI